MNEGVSTVDELDIFVSTMESQQYLTLEEQSDIQAYFERKSELAKSLATAADLLNTIQRTWRDISTGSSAIDNLLLGGFKCGTVTEISGRGSTGKTQLVISACATVQRYNTPSHQFQCIVIDTENTYSAIRQQEVLTSLKNPNASLQNIFVWKPQSLSELMELLKSLPSFLELHPQVRVCRNGSANQVKLIAIDSIAYYFRQFTDMIERSSKLNEAISYLTQIANRMQCAVASTLLFHRRSLPPTTSHPTFQTPQNRSSPKSRSFSPSWVLPGGTPSLRKCFSQSSQAGSVASASKSRPICPPLPAFSASPRAESTTPNRLFVQQTRNACSLVHRQ